GFAAATGMIVVATITLSAMVTNDLLVPLLIDRRAQTQRFGQQRLTLLRIRRTVIVVLLGLAYGVYQLGAGTAALAQIGLLSFAAAAQFAPALLGAVLWRRANRRGALVGLAAGFIVWLYTLFLPALFGADMMAAWVPGWLDPHALMGVSFGDALSHGTIWSLGLNAALFIGLSLTATERLRDRVQAVVFTADSEPRIAPQRTTRAQTVGISPDGLAALASRFLDEDAVRHAFDDFAAKAPGVRIRGGGNADWQLVQFTEKLLARAIGASSSRVIMASALSDVDVDFDDVLTLFDQRGLSERFDDHFLQSTLEAIPQGLSVVDSEQRLVAWNGAYVSMFDYPKALLRRGTPIARLIEHNIASGWIAGDNPSDQAARRVEHMRAGKPHIYERANPDGRFFRIEGSPTPGGGYVTTFTDVTRDRQREQALAEANDTLELRVQQRTQELEDMAVTLQRARDDANAANASKTRFLAAASHDLLQPLNAARLFIGAVDPEKPGQALLEKADNSIDAADTLLKGLLDMSRLDHGEVKLDMRAVPLGALFMDLIDEAAPMAQEAGLRLRHVPTRLCVRADADYLQSVLRNLLSNARRYTDQGGVLIGARRDSGNVRIEIWDTGPGIPADRTDVIFEEFERLARTDNRGVRGSGLGLSVARRMARLMDSDITVRSVEGQGSVFAVTLPRVENPILSGLTNRSATQSGLVDLDQAEIWVVDDEADIRDALAALIRRWNGRTQLFSSAESLLQAWEAGKPQAVLADHQLGDGLTGLAMVSRLRQDSPDLPMALVTAAQSQAPLNQITSARVDILPKPVDPKRLGAWLVQKLTPSAHH
ncbi:MAG: PAS-domain containing protein, partial [Pseudomonadota bacterium]